MKGVTEFEIFEEVFFVPVLSIPTVHFTFKSIFTFLFYFLSIKISEDVQVSLFVSTFTSSIYLLLIFIVYLTSLSLSFGKSFEICLSVP